MFLFPVFDYIAKNRWVQILLIVVATIATLGFYLSWRDNSVRRRERERAEIDTIKTVNKIEKEGRADADAAIEARDTAPRYGDAGSVPDDVADRIFND